MANYINQNILCQAYIHIDPVPLDESEYADFKLRIQEYIDTRGKFFLYDGIDTDIELKDGSLKIYGSILGFFYLAISQYGDFRTGVDYLEKDIKRLSEVIISESLFQSKSRHNNIIRVEARIGIIGSLKSIIDEIDHIQTSSGRVHPDDISNQLANLTNKIIKLIDNLNSDEDIKYVKENLNTEINNISIMPQPQPKKTISQESKLLYRRERRRLLLSCKIS